MPAIAVRVPGGRTFALDPAGGAAALRARVEAAQGRPLGALTLVGLGGKPLTDGDAAVDVVGPANTTDATTDADASPPPSSQASTAATAAVPTAATPIPASALPPPPPPLTPLASSVAVTVRARTQTETWSSYWKETMRTRTTEPCHAFEVELAPGDGLDGLVAAAAARAGWPAVEGLERLPGFTEPWDAAFVRGHALAPPGGDWSKLTVADAGLAGGGVLVLVRRALVPEKWNLVETGAEDGEEEEDLDSTDEEDDEPLEGEGRWCGL